MVVVLLPVSGPYVGRQTRGLSQPRGIDRLYPLLIRGALRQAVERHFGLSSGRGNRRRFHPPDGVDQDWSFRPPYPPARQTMMKLAWPDRGVEMLCTSLRVSRPRICVSSRTACSNAPGST